MRLFIIYCTVIASCFVGIAYRPDDNLGHSKAIERWYLQQLDTLAMEMKSLAREVGKAAKNEQLKARFLSVRLAYKKIAVITDYFNPYESVLLNSAALQRTEDDNPTQIIDPHGLQKLEELVWENSSENTQEIKDEAVYILSTLRQLENEPDRIYKFGDAMLWDALRSSVTRLSVLGVAGFDSPIAQLSLQEASATLLSIQQIVGLLLADNTAQQPEIRSGINKYINGALNFIRQAKDFNSFDRAGFIKDWANPLSNQLSDAVQVLKVAMPVERRPLNPLAKNIFAPNAFDINFFSPNKRYASTPERVLLGKQLFYDNQLSGNGTRSCATCHQPGKAFTDGLPKALAMDNKTELQRNTPTLLNAVFQTKQFYDSRQTLLEFQVGTVVHSEQEMGGSIDRSAVLLATQPAYLAAFKKAYPGDAEPISSLTISNAISSYMRSLQSLNSRFDQYMRGAAVAFSPEEKKGFNLFMGKAKCGTCHFAPLFNGLVPPRFSETESEVLGVPASTAKPAVLDADSGKYLFTLSAVHLHAFKTPTLRNIALTAPYMHNGVYKTLEEVVDFYNDGGGKGLGIAPDNQSLPFDKLGLSKKERKAVIAFMKTLTDTSVVAGSR